MIVPVRDPKAVLVRQVSGDGSGAELFSFGDERVAQGVWACSETERSLFVPERLVQLDSRTRFSVAGHEERSFRVVSVRPCGQVFLQVDVRFRSILNRLVGAALSAAVEFAVLPALDRLDLQAA